MTKPNKKEFHIPINIEGITCVDYLAEETGFSRQKLKQYLQKGCVWLERVDSVKSTKSDDSNLSDESKVVHKAENKQGYIQRIRRAKKKLNTNEILHFYFDEAVLDSEPSPAMLIEDLGEYSIWNKPSGMLSQGSKWGDHFTIYRWAEKHLQPERPAFIVHRLDRAANGLIILAHKKKVASQFSELFEQRQIDKRYRVEVEGDFSIMFSNDSQELTIDNSIDDKSAISHVRLLSFNSENNTSILEVKIETGRKHQIRKHLSQQGFPVLGDRLYGNGVNGGPDLQLKAQSLSFICPITAENKEFKLGS